MKLFQFYKILILSFHILVSIWPNNLSFILLFELGGEMIVIIFGIALIATVVSVELKLRENNEQNKEIIELLKQLNKNDAVNGYRRISLIFKFKLCYIPSYL